MATRVARGNRLNMVRGGRAPILQVEKLSVRFGGLQALQDVSLSVDQDEILGIIGPNGAGKSTLLNVICGLVEPDSGTVRLLGSDITNLPPHRRVALGLTKTSQKAQVFPELSVLENVLVGSMLHERSLGQAYNQARSILRFLGLESVWHRPAKDLPLAQLALLELARSLAVKPRVLLVDELMAGLNPAELAEAMDRLRRVNAEYGLTLVLVEHNMRAITGLCHRVVAMDAGRVIAQGAPAEVMRHPAVVQAYLGADKGAEDAVAVVPPPKPAGGTLLEVRGLRSGYGRLEVLHDVSLDVPEAGFVAVIGANGAGKTTLLRTISGLLAPRAGTIRFAGRDLAGLPADQVAALGIVQVPEGRQIFPEMTVEENLALGGRLNRDPEARRRQRDLVLSLFPRLAERLRQLAGTLSGGEQQMLAIGRALMSSPRLLMLDEPSQGLAPRLVSDLYAQLRQVHGMGVAILLVEQNVHLALQHAQYAYVLEQGQVVMHGPRAELVGHERIRQAYLGM